MGNTTDKQSRQYPYVLRACIILLSIVFMSPLSAQQAEKSAGQHYVDGVNYFTKSRMRDAERAFLMSLRVSPTFKAAWMGLTDVYKAQKRNDEGIAAVDKALEHFAGDPEFWIRKGIFLRESGRLKEASDALRRAVQVSSSDQAIVKRVKNELFFDRDAKGRINLGIGE